MLIKEAIVFHCEIVIFGKCDCVTMECGTISIDVWRDKFTAKIELQARLYVRVGNFRLNKLGVCGQRVHRSGNGAINVFR